MYFGRLCNRFIPMNIAYVTLGCEDATCGISSTDTMGGMLACDYAYAWWSKLDSTPTPAASIPRMSGVPQRCTARAGPLLESARTSVSTQAR